MSHLYYMIVRMKTEEAVNLDLNEFVRLNYPNAGRNCRSSMQEYEP